MFCQIYIDYKHRNSSLLTYLGHLHPINFEDLSVPYLSHIQATSNICINMKELVKSVFIAAYFFDTHNKTHICFSRPKTIYNKTCYFAF